MEFLMLLAVGLIMAVILVTILSSESQRAQTLQSTGHLTALAKLPIGITLYEISAQGVKLELVNHQSNRIIINEITLNGTKLNSSKLPLPLQPMETASLESYSLLLDTDAGYSYGLLINYTDPELDIDKIQYESTLPLTGTSPTVDSSIETDEALATGLLGLWRLDEQSWTADAAATVTDSSDSKRHGTPKDNADTSGNAISGRGGEFDGIGDYVQVDDMPLIENGTISLWINATNLTGSRQAVYISGLRDSYTLRLYRNSGWSTGLLSWLLYYNKTDSATGNILDNFQYDNQTWYHTAFTWNSTGAWNVYRDGAIRPESGQASDFESWHLGTGTFRISWNWQGLIDEVAIWNRTLTAEEIYSIYNRGR